ncbi:riboflavin synthase [Yanshouia hominis]|uniref:Riboflavin synthase n=1 Tax=Yanshouia hominis TaxID=2763673 RepID=A0ABR7NIR7_9FIRM|nr:riboflavin synthase [Yanshouia hominis]MBC8576290.1 riboflavin synthase [Yanshouia hominis]
MFTGIVEETGILRSLRPASGGGGVLAVRCRAALDGSRVGDSIAVNGVCLTVSSLAEDGFSADVMPETLRRSNLGLLSPGTRLNLERAMPADGRFGGHLVTGHIDGSGSIRSVAREGNAVWYTIGCCPEILRLIVPKGSVAVDGISLTVADTGPGFFRVSVIPHTASLTSLGGRGPGDTVNLENDCIGRYVERLLQAGMGQKPAGALTAEALSALGF